LVEGFACCQGRTHPTTCNNTAHNITPNNITPNNNTNPNDNSARLAKLLRFTTSKSPDAPTSLDEYVARMPEGQKQIYWVSAPTQAEAAKSPFLEGLVAKVRARAWWRWWWWLVVGYRFFCCLTKRGGVLRRGG
jgi:hypothetical protein